MDHPAVPAGIHAAPRQHQAQNPAAAPLQLRPPRRGRGSPRDALPRQHRRLAELTAAGVRGLWGDPTATAAGVGASVMPSARLSQGTLAGHQEEISEIRRSLSSTLPSPRAVPARSCPLPSRCRCHHRRHTCHRVRKPARPRVKRRHQPRAPSDTPTPRYGYTGDPTSLWPST